MNKIFILSIIILFILIIVGFKYKKEPLTNYTSNDINRDMDSVINYINNSINSRTNGKVNENLFSSEKYQNQILPLRNALSYANYIKNKIIK